MLPPGKVMGRTKRPDGKLGTPDRHADQTPMPRRSTAAPGPPQQVMIGPATSRKHSDPPGWGHRVPAGRPAWATAAQCDRPRRPRVKQREPGRIKIGFERTQGAPDAFRMLLGGSALARGGSTRSLNVLVRRWDSNWRSAQWMMKYPPTGPNRP